jgi:hypothetical protein
MPMLSACEKIEDTEPTNDTTTTNCDGSSVWRASLVDPRVDEKQIEIISSSFDHATYTRTVILEATDIPEDVCNEANPTCTYKVQVKKAHFKITWTGKLYWGLGKMEWPIGTTGDDVNDVAINEMRVLEGGTLKKAFPDKPAWLSLQLIAKFQSTGFDSVDREDLLEELLEAKMDVLYSKHKAN